MRKAKLSAAPATPGGPSTLHRRGEDADTSSAKAPARLPPSPLAIRCRELGLPYVCARQAPYEAELKDNATCARAAKRKREQALMVLLKRAAPRLAARAELERREAEEQQRLAEGQQCREWVTAPLLRPSPPALPSLFHLRSGRRPAGRPLDVLELRVDDGATPPTHGAAERGGGRLVRARGLRLVALVLSVLSAYS